MLGQELYLKPEALRTLKCICLQNTVLWHTHIFASIYIVDGTISGRHHLWFPEAQSSKSLEHALCSWSDNPLQPVLRPYKEVGFVWCEISTVCWVSEPLGIVLRDLLLHEKLLMYHVIVVQEYPVNWPHFTMLQANWLPYMGRCSTRCKHIALILKEGF